jgi:uncharacterized protein (DUF885 family)
MTADDDRAGTAGIAALAGELWEAKLAAGPLWAAFLGDHRFDDQADDLSAEGEQDLRSTWVGLRDRASAVGGELSETDRVTRDLLIEQLDLEIRGIDLRLRELMSDQLQGIHTDLLITADQLRAAEPEHATMAVERVRQFGRMLDQAAGRYVEGLAAGRPPARVNVERSIHQVEGYLASALGTDPFVTMAGPEGWDGLDAWRDDLADAVRTHLRPAFARYRDVLRDQLLPAARPDDRCGLVWLEDGPELYRALVERHTGLPLDADELHAAGMAEVTESLPAEYVDCGRRQFATTDLPEIFARLVDDPGLRYRDRDEMLAHVTRCVEAAHAAMGDWFGLLPRSPCVITPIPDYLAPDATLAYYSPPSTDGSRPAEYHVNLHEPTRRSRAVTASVAFHEAIPGHHLQLAISAERTDLPAFRRLSLEHAAFLEGWGLYAERLADEMGLYETDVDRMGMLANESWRASRLVVDTGLHAFGWSRQQAIDFIVEHVPVNRNELVVDIDRYIGWPGQALAYKVGQRELLGLRRRAQEALGPRFEVKAFHDAVLGAGTVSLRVLRDQVARLLAA